ncbi:MAG TPA: molybdenum cofactor guanylyltransferase [Bacillales bacterium]|nr:molybdenum cofactor guanylyltransferase [Bacillales bacterium]
MKVGAIILSGGKSSRMGTNKALLEINQKPNIERIASQLKRNFDELILVTNDPEAYQFLDLTTVRDRYPKKGPLAGIHAGLTASRCEVNLIVACDMPFISVKLALDLVHQIGNYDAVIPVINGKQHPLFSVFKKKTIVKIEESIKNNCLKMQSLVNHLDVLYITENNLQEYTKSNLERIFFNMNHPNEYEHAKEWAKREQREEI